MIKSKRRMEFDYIADENLKNSIIDKYGFLLQSQYEFSKRLIHSLIDINVTNAEFATMTGLSEGTISNYANGKRMPRGNELEVIATKLFVTPNYLLGLTDCTTFSAEEMNKILGLSEDAMKTFAMLNYNVEEIQDLMDPMEVSNVHKEELNVFSLFVSNISNFREFLTYIKRYVEVKQEINKLNDTKEKGLNDKQEIENLEDKLLRN